MTPKAELVVLLQGRTLSNFERRRRRLQPARILPCASRRMNAGASTVVLSGLA